MSLRRRIERVEEWGDEWQVMELAKKMAPESQQPVEELAAQMLQDLRDMQAMMREGLTVDEALWRFAEEELGCDPDQFLRDIEKGLAQSGAAEVDRVQ